MHRSARTVLCGGRPAMAVPTATTAPVGFPGAGRAGSAGSRWTHSDTALLRHQLRFAERSNFGPASRRWTAVIGLLDPNGPFLRIIVCEGRGQLAVGIGLPLKR
jgi:hypothetical protein